MQKKINIGDVIGLFGPTGSGKTSFLNSIALEYSETCSISYAFQDSRLLPELSVKENICLPLNKLLGKNQAEQEAEKWISVFQLENLKDKKAANLSGGEAQRVNLARAFARNGQIFLLDEPFSAQDENNKKIILDSIVKIINAGKTVLIVSHSYEDLVFLNCKILKF